MIHRPGRLPASSRYTEMGCHEVSVALKILTDSEDAMVIPTPDPWDLAFRNSNWTTASTTLRAPCRSTRLVVLVIASCECRGFGDDVRCGELPYRVAVFLFIRYERAVASPGGTYGRGSFAPRE